MLKTGSLVDGKYKVLNKIGHGGMSVVYLAMNEKANKQWAIKEVRKDGLKNFNIVKQGLVVETEMLKRLNHPNLPSIIDVIEDEKSFLIVMDYIQGNPLSQALEEDGVQPQKYVIEWARQLCDVLGYLHGRVPAIIYRDMKPANVMLSPGGKLTLIDFGTAREYKEKNSADTTCLGTIGYAAPEQFGGQGQTDERTDIYSLGATLYHLVTGCNPCEPPYEIRLIREINPALSGGLEKIIEKCTARNPADRYQSCAEMMYDLERYEEIDDHFIRKQKHKLKQFMAVVMLTVLFGASTIFGYISAENKMNENYDLKIAAAVDAKLNQAEQTELYMEAIALDASRKEAYLGIMELFLSSTEEMGSLSVEEASFITQLKAGIDVENKEGYSTTMYPLAALKSQNRKGYEEVCYEIGMAYWYDYQVVTERYTAASEWLKEVMNVFPIAQTYVEIGECQRQVKRYAGQNRTEKMYETYQMLWEKIYELQRNSLYMNENDMKIIVWVEIVDLISEQADYFIVNIDGDEMLTLLDEINIEAFGLKDSTKYEDIKSLIETLQEKINMAKERIHMASKNGVR